MDSSHLQDRTFQDIMSEFYDGRPLRDIEWAAKFALHPAGFNYVWNTYCTPQDAGSAHWSHLCPDTPLELLQTVSHLCEYRKESAACVDWRISKPTYRKHWQTTLWYLAANLNEIHWEARLEGFQPMATSYFSNVEGSLDCTECPIRRPRSEPHQRCRVQRQEEKPYYNIRSWMSPVGRLHCSLAFLARHVGSECGHSDGTPHWRSGQAACGEKAHDGQRLHRPASGQDRHSFQRRLAFTHFGTADAQLCCCECANRSRACHSHDQEVGLPQCRLATFARSPCGCLSLLRQFC